MKQMRVYNKLRGIAVLTAFALSCGVGLAQRSEIYSSRVATLQVVGDL